MTQGRTARAAPEAISKFIPAVSEQRVRSLSHPSRVYPRWAGEVSELAHFPSLFHSLWSNQQRTRETPSMTSATFDFAPLLPSGLPAPAAKWTGLAKYRFVGGNNDPDQVPVDGLIDAVNAVLRREGKTLATYGLASGPQGYRPLREFLTTKLKRDAGIGCAADDILIVSGSLQALDLVNATLLARGDTVIIERDSYQGAINRLTRLGVNTVGIPLDREGMRMDALAQGLAALKGHGITPKYIYTIP